MAYNSKGYSSWTPSKGMVQPGQHTYNGLLSGDSLATIKSPDYFLPLQRDKKLQINDVIYIVATDGNDLVRFTQLEPTVTVSEFIVGLVPDGSITTAKLANNAVTTPKITDGAVTEQKIATDAVTGSKIATNAVTSDAIANGAVGTSELAAFSVITNRIAFGAVGENQLASNLINGPLLRSTSTSTPANEANMKIGYSFQGTPATGSPLEKNSVQTAMFIEDIILQSNGNGAGPAVIEVYLNGSTLLTTFDVGAAVPGEMFRADAILQRQVGVGDDLSLVHVGVGLSPSIYCFINGIKITA